MFKPTRENKKKNYQIYFMVRLNSDFNETKISILIFEAKYYISARSKINSNGSIVYILANWQFLIPSP